MCLFLPISLVSCTAFRVVFYALRVSRLPNKQQPERIRLHPSIRSMPPQQRQQPTSGLAWPALFSQRLAHTTPRPPPLRPSPVRRHHAPPKNAKCICANRKSQNVPTTKCQRSRHRRGGAQAAATRGRNHHCGKRQTRPPRRNARHEKQPYSPPPLPLQKGR